MITAEAAMNGSIQVQKSYLDSRKIYYPTDAKDTLIKRLVRNQSHHVYRHQMADIPFSYESKLFSAKEIYASIVNTVGSFELAFEGIGISYEEAKSHEYLIIFAHFYVPTCDAVEMYKKIVPKKLVDATNATAQNQLVLELDGLEFGAQAVAIHAGEKDSPEFKLIKRRRGLCDRYFKVIRLKEKIAMLIDKTQHIEILNGGQILSVVDFDVAAVKDFRSIALN